MDQIDVVWGDTDLVPVGRRHDGLALAAAGRRGRRQGRRSSWSSKAKKLAAKLLEADEADIVLDKDAGAFHVAGTPAVSKSWAELAVRRDGRRRAADDRHRASTASGATFPFGAHVAVVEVDTETGQVQASSATSPATTPARVLNPLLLEGQIHGGIAQGAAQALLEEVRYDDDGNPITSNLADYAFISRRRAAELRGRAHGDADVHQPARAPRASASRGTIGSTPAVQSAVVDAVSHLGVRHIDMPSTAERVWQAIQAAKS